MVFKSFAKINLSLTVNKKLETGLHDIQSIYCLIDLSDSIFVKKTKGKRKDVVSIKGKNSMNINKKNNSITRTLSIMRKYNLIHDYYSVKIVKKIPVFAGLGGGSSNAAALLKFFKKKIPNKIFEKIIDSVGSDLRLFYKNQGYQKNIRKVVEIKKKHKLIFLLAYPGIKCSTKNVYSKVDRFSKKRPFSDISSRTKKEFIKYLINSKNELQSIVEKKHPFIRKLLTDINKQEGCYFSRMTGSGSVCYGLFNSVKCSKAALKKIRKKYANCWFSIAKTI